MLEFVQTVTDLQTFLRYLLQLVLLVSMLIVHKSILTLQLLKYLMEMIQLQVQLHMLLSSLLMVQLQLIQQLSQFLMVTLQLLAQ